MRAPTTGAGDVTGKGAKYRSIPALDVVVDRIHTYLTERGNRFAKHCLEERSTPLFACSDR